MTDDDITLDRVLESWRCERDYVEPEQIYKSGGWRVPLVFEIVPIPSPIPEWTFSAKSAETSSILVTVEPLYMKWNGVMFRGWSVRWGEVEIDRYPFLAYYR